MPANPNDPSLVALAINPGNFELNVPSLEELRALGATWVRFLLYDTYQNFQTGQNTALDRLLDLYRDLGVNVLVLVNPETLGASPPAHGATGWGDANSGYIGRAADTAAKIAGFYRGKIAALEVFNEPDVMLVEPEDYALILKAAYAKIKAVTNEVPVVSAGICCGQAFEYLTRVLRAAPNSCDQVAWHPYGQRVDNFPSANWGIGDLRDSLVRASAIAGKPLWITEIGADLYYSWPHQSSPEQGVAEYLKRSYALMRDLGPTVVAHAFWFTWKHPDGHYGMVDNNEGRRPAWYAFQREAQFAPPSAVSIMGVSFSPVTLQPNEVLNVAVTVKNNLSETIRTQAPDPGFSYDEGDTFYSRGFAEVRGAYRIGIEFDGRTGVDHPYRWGLGAPLAPGETRIVTGAIRLKNAQSRNYWAGLVQEQIAWTDDGSGKTLVAVAAGTNAPPRIDRVNFALGSLDQRAVLNVSITVTNPGTASLATMGPDPGFVYDEGDNFYTRNFPEIPGAHRIGVDFDGRVGIDHPYRWGLDAPLAPGEARTITGAIRLKTPGTRNYWAGLVQEQRKWIQDRAGVQPISVGDPLAGDARIVAVSISPATLASNQLLGVSVTVRNDSSIPLLTQAPEPGLVYEEGDTFITRGFADVRGAFRVGVDFDGRVGIDHPYRWGLGAPLAPGEARTITGFIRLTSAQSRTFWAGLVQEQIAWRDDHSGAQPVTVIPPGELHLVAANFSPQFLNMDGLLNVSITVKNDSTATVTTQGPDPGFVYREGDSFYTHGFPDVAGAYRVGVDFDERVGIDHPYRWGLGSPLAPGEARTITGAIQLTRAQAQDYWAGLVQERVAWHHDRVGVSTITAAATTQPRVAHVHDARATNWNGEGDYWNYVNQNVVDDMVARGMIALTGAATVAAAWSKILPHYQPSQTIAIKVNFTNDGALGKIDSLPQTLNAILRGLREIGVHEEDVLVYDNRSIADYYVQMCQFPGVRFADGVSRGGFTFDSTDPTAVIPFAPPLDVPSPGALKITDVLVNATYLINLPTFKAHVTGAGVTLGFKNHQGSHNDPAALHAYCWLAGQYFRADWNPLVDLNRITHIRDKTVLTIGDGLFTGDRWNSTALTMQTFSDKTPNSLFFSTDPVAIDSVMYDLLDAEWHILSGADGYLRLASQLGMGVFERGDPRGAGYQQIDYRKV